MKNLIVIVGLIGALLSFLTVGCTNKHISDKKFELEIDDNGNYTGFDNLKNYNYTQDIIVNNWLLKYEDEIIGSEYWNKFFENVDSNIDSYIRILSIDSKKIIDCIDLYYIDNEYCMFKYTSKDQSVTKYQYISTDPNNTYSFLLTNDQALTYNKLFTKLASSEQYTKLDCELFVTSWKTNDVE